MSRINIEGSTSFNADEAVRQYHHESDAREDARAQYYTEGITNEEFAQMEKQSLQDIPEETEEADYGYLLIRGLRSLGYSVTEANTILARYDASARNR